MVRIVLVMHQPLASAFLECAKHVLGELPHAQAFDVPANADVNELSIQLTATLASHSLGTLVICDLVGATPFNIAQKAVYSARNQGANVSMLTGANLNMVIKALTDQIADPHDLRDSVCSGGVRGIISACMDNPTS